MPIQTPFKLVEVLFRWILNSSFTVFDSVMSCSVTGEMQKLISMKVAAARKTVSIQEFVDAMGGLNDHIID